MGKERRKQERFDANLFAELENIASKENLGRAVVVDVSLSGMAVETESDISTDIDVDLYVEVPFHLRAKVVRRIADGQIKRYGLQFTGQGFIDKLLLRKLLKGKRQSRKVQL